jgi:hypothetical protein
MPGPVEAVDDTLQLYFLCAHPSLTPASPVALTLRAVGGSSCPTRYGHHRVSSCVTSLAKAARPDRRRGPLTRRPNRLAAPHPSKNAKASSAEARCSRARSRSAGANLLSLATRTSSLAKR